MSNDPNQTCPRLIEVALPIREISAESVRDKSLRHGHISTLHLWWARRPLAASRAVVFASLVPDPDDPNCPKEFREAVLRLLKDKLPSLLKAYRTKKEWVNDGDPYRPYDGIPDTPRNRLLTFIAKWSPLHLAFEKGQREDQPKPAEMLDDRCLVKWETSDPENPQGQEVLKIARELVRIANGGKPPTVLDPFAGGGAIPLEATRLGCQAIANDYNPVAYLILRATCEFPQRYGKRLAQDVEHWAKWTLNLARQRIGGLYPPGKDGRAVIGYLWVRTVPCSNPACKAEIPLRRSLLVCDMKNKQVALTITKHGKEVSFGIAVGRDIKDTEGTMLTRGDCRCPICKQVTPVADIRQAGLDGEIGERMVAVITETQNGKDYRPVEPTDLKAFEEAEKFAKKVERPSESILPEITGENSDDVANSTGIRVHLYGMTTWGALFNARQLFAMQTFVGCIREALQHVLKKNGDKDFQQAIAVYLSSWVCKLSMFANNVARWRSDGEFLDSPFSMQKISMAWDYPEVNPFNASTAGIAGQLEWIIRVICHEASLNSAALHPAQVCCGDAAHLPASIAADAVVTDPPYFDAISFADLSDFFYVWHKRALSNLLPDIFATPTAPKTEEATALKHRHNGDTDKANRHFTKKLSASLAEAKRRCRPDGVVAVMFAHQTTEAWTALINAVFDAGLSVTATYPLDTELANRARAIESSALASSITVICRRRQVGAAASFKDVRKEIEKVVAETVHRFFDVYGFRGADLIVACYGPAVGVFGKYERVEKADGTPVDVPTLLEFAKESALKAIAGEFTGDVQSRLYYVWSNLYGTSEQAWDDARLVVQVGGDSEDAMAVARERGLFVVHGSSCRLALLKDRSDKKHLGDEADSPLIDQLHHALRLWKGEKRDELVEYLAEHELTDHAPFWKLAQALFEVLPRDIEDWKLISALLGERESLRTQAKRTRLL